MAYMNVGTYIWLSAKLMPWTCVRSGFRNSAKLQAFSLVIEHRNLLVTAAEHRKRVPVNLLIVH